MAIGALSGADAARTLKPANHPGEHNMVDDFWDEHDRALTGPQTGIIVAAILVLSTLLSVFG